MILSAFILYYLKFINFFYFEEKIESLEIIILLFKLGFYFNAFGFCYYYGNHILKMILKPIAFEFIPYHIRDDIHIKGEINYKMINHIYYDSFIDVKHEH